MRVPAAAELVGTYDLTTTVSGGSQPVLGIGSVGVQDEELVVGLTAPPVSLRGTLAPDGTYAFEGHTTHSDAVTLVEGTARVEARGDVLRIDGTIEGVLGAQTFRMERPIGTSLASATGRYRVTFVTSPGGCGCETHADLDLTIADTGSGSGGTAEEIDAGGTVVGSLVDISVRISPGRRFDVTTSYGSSHSQHCTGSAPVFTCTLSLGGSLAAADEAASGVTFLLKDVFTFPVSNGTGTLRRTNE